MNTKKPNQPSRIKATVYSLWFRQTSFRTCDWVLKVSPTNCPKPYPTLLIGFQKQQQIFPFPFFTLFFKLFIVESPPLNFKNEKNVI